MAWEIILVSEVLEWFHNLDSETENLVAAALDLLEERGPSLGRPLVDTLSGVSVKNLKELRPGSSGKTEVRILFVFDPKRQAILLTAGDKSGNWDKWYIDHIAVAEKRYEMWLSGKYDKED